MVRTPTVWEETSALMGGVAALPDDASALEELAKGLPPDAAALLRGFTNPKYIKMSLTGLKIFNTALSSVLERRAAGKKVAFYCFSFPREILDAMDMAPVCTEAAGIIPVLALGGEEFIDAPINAGLPESICGGHKASVGIILEKAEIKPDVIINAGPGSCDPNAKLHEYMAELWDIPLLNLDAPYYHDERSFRYYRREFRRMVERLEEIVGHKVDYDRLREILDCSNQSTELYWEIQDLKKADPYPLSNIYCVLVELMKYIWSGRPEALEYFQIARDTAKELVEKGEGAFPNQRARTLWTYSGIYFDMELFRWLEEIGVAFVQDCFGWFPDRVIDTTTVDTMLEGLADRTLNQPMTRQMKGAWDGPAGWAEDMVFLARELNIDSVIFSGNLACKQSWGALRLITERLRNELGIPTLRLETDILDKRITPTSVIKEQIEEFISTMV
jgi:benzoyl-CoA reductase subunit B